MIDVCRHLVEVTYGLEGDGPLVFTCDKQLQAVATAFGEKNVPSLKAVAREIADKDATGAVNADALVTHTMLGHQPAITFFLRKLHVDLVDNVTAFRGALIFDPVTAQSLNDTGADIQRFRCFPFFDNDELLQGLLDQLPHYLAAIVDVDIVKPEDKWMWWRRQREEPNLTNWCSAVQKLVLVQPSSAASERVFSLLAATYSHQQESSLEDGLEASIMMQYNERQ